MTYHERNRLIHHRWKCGMNTYEIAEQLGLPESYVERIVFDYVIGRKRKAAA